MTIFRSIKGKRAFEEIADQIRELIFTGVLKPGDKLPSERELAEQFGAGRMVLREALRILENAGFLNIRQGSEGGAFVKNADMSVVSRSFSDLLRLGNVSIQNLTEARLGIEKTVIEVAAFRADDRDFELLERNIEEAELLISRGLRPRENNVNFHLLLARASKNPVFEIISQSVMDMVSYFLQKLTPDMDYIKGILIYHRDIVDALKRKDSDMARVKLEDHLLEVNRKLIELFEKSKKEGGESINH
jgi:GntR family transcriptional regulator, transcriptional repressor for pyruvate dehydrogenase complex